VTSEPYNSSPLRWLKNGSRGVIGCLVGLVSEIVLLDKRLHISLELRAVYTASVDIAAIFAFPRRG
jgi:hypothetical protein